MLVKSSSFPSIKFLDVSVKEKIWFELEGLPNFVFGGIYIRSSNILFFRDEAFPYITYSKKHQIKINAMCLVVI